MQEIQLIDAALDGFRRYFIFQRISGRVVIFGLLFGQSLFGERVVADDGLALAVAR